MKKGERLVNFDVTHEFRRAYLKLPFFLVIVRCIENTGDYKEDAPRPVISYIVISQETLHLTLNRIRHCAYLACARLGALDLLSDLSHLTCNKKCEQISPIINFSKM